MRTVRAIDVGAKVALVVLLLVAVVFPDLGGVKGRASGARLVVYPLGALAVPIWWWLRGRRLEPGRAYPWLADLLVTLPWLLDTIGNRFGLFESILWWDDMMHFLNWLLLVAGILLAWSPRGMSRVAIVVCGLGFGTPAALLWELGEYAAYMRALPEFRIAYVDTLGDLVLGTLGSLVAGVVVAFTSGRRPAG